VKVLGRLTDYKSEVGVPYQQVLDPVLAEVGIDPARSPWPLTGAKPLGLYRIIGFAYRNQRPNITSSRYSGKRLAMCMDFGRGIWGLTPDGVSRSRELRDFEFPRIVSDLYPDASPDIDPELIPEREPEQDTRDDLTWVVLELTRMGEMKVEEGQLEASIRRALSLEDDHPVFIPATSYSRGDRVVTLQLMEGYAFVATGLDEVVYFSLERTGYVNQVMSAVGPNGMRVLQTIPHRNIEDMKRKLRGLAMLDVNPGDQVKVVEGKYSGLQMEVIDVEDEHVSVITKGLRSLSVITRLPKMFLALDKTEEEMWEE
jgi:transcription antitermination factor NusG